MGNSGSAVTIGAEGKVLATGYFIQSANFGCGQMQSASQGDGFVVKITP
jgi:hypothetical protein